MLYTGKGDKGDTGLFGCDQRISKSSAIAEALGSMDEVNSFLGFAKLRSKEAGLRVGTDGVLFTDLVHDIQKTLFIIQAELAGTQMTVEEEKVREIEAVIAAIEGELPPIHSFFISGGSELSSLFDFSRTLARRAERRVVAVAESLAQTKEGEENQKKEGRKIGAFTLAYLNRLSSVLYALARLSNHKSGITEQSPDYK